jgi:hypothetical protein
MSQNRTMYVINVDLAGSKVHLNPEYFGENWCNLDQVHVRSIGGRIEVNGQEAEDYLTGKITLIFDEGNFRSPQDAKTSLGNVNKAFTGTLVINRSLREFFYNLGNVILT